MKTKQPVTMRQPVKDTQKTISEYHCLLKQSERLERELKKSLEKRKAKELAIVKEKLNKIGLDTYQLASIKSCEKGRGSCGHYLIASMKKYEFQREEGKKVKVLDVGAITGQEYIKYRFMEVVSIDLQSQSPLVKKCDFFDYRQSYNEHREPVELENDDVVPQQSATFDIVCLSLVLNFVPHPLRRGEMLLHAHTFIKPNGWLYVVLPLPCISNSRYFDRNLLIQLVNSIGFRMVCYKESKKLCYLVFERLELGNALKSEKPSKNLYKKTEIHSGKKKNNFCILLPL
jgi:25S rRNA (adenine2142-N1)-methyltransferase